MTWKDLEIDDEIEPFNLNSDDGVMNALEQILDFSSIEEDEAAAIEAALKLLREYSRNN